MKKMFFTAIALVAFSGVSMAETGAVEKTTAATQIIGKKNCGLIVSSNLSNWEEMYGCIEDSNAYSSLYNLMYVICMSA